MILPKHSFTLPLFLMTAASRFNPVSAGTAFETKNDLRTAVNSFCDGIFDENASPYGPIEDWDVSGITDMASLFQQKGSCNPEIGSWDVSNVITFVQMFYMATNFNQNISGWDVGSGTSFYYMFASATNFNQDISGWDVRSGTVFRAMFDSAKNFNQDISGWDVRSGTDFVQMFRLATNFNQDISGWDVGSGTSFAQMFYRATNFNQDISGWDVRSGTDFSQMFASATNFNQDISGWDVGSGTNFYYMFVYAKNFNQDISGWDVRSGTNFNGMFRFAMSFDQTLIYCKWQSNNYFTTGTNVCERGANCGWGETTCPTPVPPPTATLAPSMSPTTSLSPTALLSTSPTVPPTTTPATPLSWMVDVKKASLTNNNNGIAPLIIVPFNISNRDHTFELFDGTSCNASIGDTIPISINIGSNNGYLNGDISLHMIQSSIEANPNVWYGDNINGGIASFCVSTSLYSDNSKLWIVASKQVIYHVSIDKAQGFVLNDIKTNRDTIQRKYGPDNATILAYLCDRFTQQPLNAPTITQANNITTICVESTSIIQVLGLEKLSLIQPAIGSYNSYTYDAVMNGIPMHDSISHVAKKTSSTGKKVAYASVTLAADFFRSINPPPINVTGVVSLDVGGAYATRKLMTGYSPDDVGMDENVDMMNVRHLMSNDEMEFSLSIKLAGVDEEDISGLSFSEEDEP